MLIGLAIAVLASACSQSGNPPKSETHSSSPTKARATNIVPAHPSSGCSLPKHPELTLAKQTIVVDGTARWYLISTPPDSTGRPDPVVLDFHGLGEGAQLEALTTQLSPLGKKDGFISVFPQGSGYPVGWNTTSDSPSNHDLTFVSLILDRVEATQCVDETRIYATGLSDGAFMTSFLACAMSNRITAFAPVSGVQFASRCAAKRRVPVLAFHGTADPILYFNGGVGVAVLQHLFNKGPAPSVSIPPARLDGPGYPAAVAAWATHDGCAPTPVDTKVSPHVIYRVYKCPTGTAVEFYIVLGGGHAWPGSKFSQQIAAITGPTTFEIHASTIIWAFFERFQL
jgi:polyhydroxybutyrate depolymerase